ncbi:MAG: protein-ADP-ribose hydrolase [Atopobiaceae bacterium]|jgi:O-acetyl-ADP-ribose deacetylase (regulator of RNase III)
MNQQERRLYLIEALLQERGENTSYTAVSLAQLSLQDQRKLLRALFNVRPPVPATQEFLAVQDAYLQEEIKARGITSFSQIREANFGATTAYPGIYLWRGDICTLACDAIVNAANGQLLGCFQPNHSCIDNAIHTFAGVQLRLACNDYVQSKMLNDEKLCADVVRASRWSYEEPCGRALLTDAFNLPARYVLHTVGPVAAGQVDGEMKEQLASCYRACMARSEEAGLTSVAFCCISTGVFGFPQRTAARIAVSTVLDYRAQYPCAPEVVFDVFSEEDYDIYQQILG